MTSKVSMLEVNLEVGVFLSKTSKLKLLMLKNPCFLGRASCLTVGTSVHRWIQLLPGGGREINTSLGLRVEPMKA